MIARRLFLLSLLAVVPLTFAPGARAQTAQKFKPAVLFDARELSERTLPNGVRGVVLSTRNAQDGGPNVISVQVWVRAGSRFENSDTAGAASVLEEACLRGSQNYPAKPGDDETTATTGGARGALLGVGAQVASQTSRDSTFYSATVAPAFLNNAVRALSDAVLRPRLSDADISAAKLRAANQAVARGGDALALASDTAYEAAFSRHPYKRPAGSTPANLAKVSPAFVRGFHATHYTARDISVVIVGHIDPQAAHALIAREFGSAAKSTESSRVQPETPPVALKTVTLRRPLRAATVALAWGAPPISAPQDVVAMDVLLSYWKEGSQAGLRAPLLGRDVDPSDPDAQPDEGALALAYDVDFLTQRDPGLLIVTVIATPASREAAAKAVLNEAARVRREGLTDAQLARAKAALRTQYLQGSETPSGAAGALGFYEMIADYKFAQTYLERTSKVTSADVRRVANKYLLPAKYVQVIIEPQTPAPRPTEPPEGTITASLPRF